VLILLRLTYIAYIVIQIYPKSNSCKSTRWTRGEQKLRKLFRRFRVSWKLQTWLGVSGLSGYKYPFHRGQLGFYCPLSFDRRPSPSRRLPLSLISPLGDFCLLHPKSRVWVRVWVLQGVQIEDLHRFRKIEGPPPLSKGITPVNSVFTALCLLTAALHPPIASLSPSSRPLAIFAYSIQNLECEWGFECSKVCRSKIFIVFERLKAFHLSPKVSLDGILSIYFPRIILVVSS
jgi:hypothetical protein